MLTKLEDRYDAYRLLECFLDYGKHQQVHVSSPDGETYVLESGDLSKLKLEQNDFTQINKAFKGTYVEEVYNDLNEKYDVCRGRFMLLDHTHRGYSYHYDLTDRIHIPLVTNRDAIFLVEDQIYKMQDIGSTYRLHTTHKHTAMNLGKEERIHFTVCVKSSAAMSEYYARMIQ